MVDIPSLPKIFHLSRGKSPAVRTKESGVINMTESTPSLSRGKTEFLIKIVDFENKLGSLLHDIRG